jgi:hypothetical protein
MYLEIFGNLVIREKTGAWLRNCSKKLAKKVTKKTGGMHNIAHSCDFGRENGQKGKIKLRRQAHGCEIFPRN